MGFYHERILPHVIDKVCSLGQVMKQRSQVVPQCAGTVLEVGMGSGINLQFYQPGQVDRVYGLEPSMGMRRMAQHHLSQAQVDVTWLDLPGEQIPLEDNSVDTVLLTFTLCTIPDWSRAMQQMHRVLRPNGKLLFLEHGAAPDAGVKRWQDRLTPCWKHMAGGCHLNREIPGLIEQSGFSITRMEQSYMPKTPRFAGYVYQGEAVLRGE